MIVREVGPAERQLLRRIVLGPCPCATCGVPLAWDGTHWRELMSRKVHGCRGLR